MQILHIAYGLVSDTDFRQATEGEDAKNYMKT